MLQSMLVVVALLPAFIWGWKIPDVEKHLGKTVHQVLDPPQNETFFLIAVPWTLLAVSWGAWICNVRSALAGDSPMDQGFAVLGGACLSVWTAGIAMQCRLHFPTVLKLLSVCLRRLHRKFA